MLELNTMFSSNETAVTPISQINEFRGFARRPPKPMLRLPFLYAFA